MSAEGGAKRTMSFLGAAGWSVALTIALTFAIELAELARPGARADLVTVVGCHLVAHLGLVFAMVRVYAPEARLRDTLGFRPVPLFVPPLAALAGAGCYPTLALLDGFLSRNMTRDAADLELLSKLTAVHGTSSRVVLVVALVALAPLAEELFFRGVLFGALRDGRPAMTAVLATAAYYALANLDPMSFGSTLTLGLLLAWMRAETGSTLTAIVAHASYEAVPVFRLLTGADDDAYPRAWTAGGALATVLAGVALFAASARRRGNADA